MSSLHILTDERSRQIELAHVAFSAERLAGIAGQVGNPHEAHITRFGRSVALTAALPLGWMNTIHLIGEPNVDRLRDVVAGYRKAGRRLRVEVLPADLTPEVGGALADLGLVQQGFHAAMFAPMGGRVAVPLSERVEIHPVSASNFELFLDTFLAGFQSSPMAKQNMRHWIERDNWRLYLATLDGRPAAAAVLSVHGSLGYLAAAATVPKLRGTGCHTALINRRIVDAWQLGCELIVGLCAYGSVSHRNQQRAGLQLSHTKAVWSER